MKAYICVIIKIIWDNLISYSIETVLFIFRCILRIRSLDKNNTVMMNNIKNIFCTYSVT